jgi:hypothetical protein
MDASLKQVEAYTKYLEASMKQMEVNYSYLGIITMNASEWNIWKYTTII